MVRLKVELEDSIYYAETSFNSTMVRLKADTESATT